MVVNLISNFLVMSCLTMKYLASERQGRRMDSKSGEACSNVVGINCSPALVEIGLTDLTTSRGAMVSLAPTTLKWKDAEFLSNQEK